MTEVSVLATPFATACLPAEKGSVSFKDRVLSFKWEQANGKELENFVNVK